MISAKLSPESVTTAPTDLLQPNKSPSEGLPRTPRDDLIQLKLKSLLNLESFHSFKYIVSENQKNSGLWL